MRGPLVGARLLDLYAGTGAVGIEALSRGASHVCFVESDDVAVGVIRANLVALELAGGAVRHERVERFVSAQPDGAAYDVCFADPPYADDATRVANNLAAVSERWLTADAVVVVERSSKDPDWAWPAGFSTVRSRRYGDATLWYGRRS
jgi:16S rRNA (guanine966-N2)-methyltransferase